MDTQQRSEVARQLLAAYSSREPIAPLTSTYADLTLDDAYALQVAQIDAWTQAGRTIMAMGTVDGARRTLAQQAINLQIVPVHGV